MESDNPTGADNQQETPSLCNIVLDPNWIVGLWMARAVSPFLCIETR